MRTTPHVFLCILKSGTTEKRKFFSELLQATNGKRSTHSMKLKRHFSKAESKGTAPINNAKANV